MKKLILFCLAMCTIVAVQAQEKVQEKVQEQVSEQAQVLDFPYSKYLTYSKADFRESQFKYDDYTNSWAIKKKNGLMVTVNILAILVDGSEDVRPASSDYKILVQLGDDDAVSYVQVIFYSDDVFHRLLTFLKTNGEGFVDTSSGKLLKYQAYYNGYYLELNMDQHIISRTSSRTVDSRTVKNVDESYNEYTFFIETGVEAKSRYLDKMAAKKAKRAAKGKKADLHDMM